MAKPDTARGRVGCAARSKHPICAVHVGDATAEAHDRSRTRVKAQEKPLGEAAFPYERNEENEGLFFLHLLGTVLY